MIKLANPGTMAAIAQLVHVMSTPATSWASLAISGFAAIAVKNIADVIKFP